ncbi:MAG: ArsI/CadI family heavy metal resistance metalloenzyme [Bacteroidota bacterium]
MTPFFPRMHVSLYVADLAATLAFYDRFFGQTPTKVQKHYAKYELQEPGLIISFVENANQTSAHFGHLGIQVGSPEELQRRHIIAREQNLVSNEEMGVTCCYAVQDKFWATDPDGHQWEVYYFHADATFNDPAYDLTVASGEQTALAAASKIDKEACGCGIGSTCC